MTSTWKPIAVGVAVVLIGVALVVAVARLASDPEAGVDINLGVDTFQLGRVETWAEEIRDNGPVVFPDASPNRARDIVISHEGADALRGWTVFEARPPGTPRECNLFVDRATTELRDPCNGDAVVPDDGGDLPRVPFRITPDNVLEVTLRPPSGRPPSGSTTSAPGALYALAGPPAVPESTLEIPADNDLADGVYYGVARVGEAPGVVMELTQLFTGEACRTWGAVSGDPCDNDYGVDGDPQAFRPLPSGATVTVARSDAPGTSYRIDAAELTRLVGGEPPAAGAPAGFAYTPFAFIVTIADGEVTRAEQWWTP